MRYRNKHYWRLPFKLGEIQYGAVSHSLVVWFRGKRYILWAGTR